MSKLSTAYRPDIDGLRGIAVFCVVVFHAGLPGFSGGFVGVDIFFVISGYLICSIIQREIEEQRFSYAVFYARRARRILPALFAMLLTCYVIATLVLTGSELKDFSKSAVANLAAVSNIYFWNSANYFATASELKPLMMTWSLSVEEQFYVVFPPLLLLVRRLRWHTGAALAALTVASLLASVIMTASAPSSAFFLLPSRAWEMSVGALLAYYHADAARRNVALSNRTQQLLAAAGLLGLAYAIISFDHETRFPGIAAAVPVCATALLIASPASAINRLLLSNKALVFVGLVSYSWYLWHWPLLSFTRVVADHAISLSMALTLVSISFALAVLSWRFVEQPFRNAGPDIRRTLLRYGSATGAMLTFGLLLVVGRGWTQRLPSDFVTIERSGQVVYDPCLAPYGASRPNLSPACVSAGERTIALIGDSHAAALAPALRTLSNSKGIGYTQLTKSSCPTLRGVTRFMLNYPAHDRECAAFNEASLRLIRDDPRIQVVFFAGYWSAPFDAEHLGQRFIRSDRPGTSVTPAESRALLRSGMEATVDYLTSAGKTVVLLHDVPMFNFDPVRAVAGAAIPLRKRLAALLDISPSGDGKSVTESGLVHSADPTRDYIDAIARHYAQVTVIDPAKTLCTHGRCNYSDGHNMYYVDSQHLSVTGAHFTLDRPMVVSLLRGQGVVAEAATNTATQQH